MQRLQDFKYPVIFLLWMILTLWFAGSADARSNDPVQHGDLSAGTSINRPIAEAYGDIPLSFIPNQGQCAQAIKFYEKSGNHATYFTRDGIYLLAFKEIADTGANASGRDGRIDPPLKIAQDYLKLSFLNAKENYRIEAQDELGGRVNCFYGNDRSRWKTNLTTYRSIVFKQIYDGIDVRFYGNGRQLEYDIIVAPGADPSAVALRVEDLDQINVTDNHKD